MNITHISADTDFWTYADWDCFVYLSEYYTPLNPVTLFNALYIRMHVVGVKKG
jgi:hypothetical protein